MYKFVALFALVALADGFIGDVLSVRNQVPSDITTLAANVVNKRPNFPGTPGVITQPLPQVPASPVEPSSPIPAPVPTPPVVPSPVVVASPQAVAIATARANVVVRKAPKVIVKPVKPVVYKKSTKPSTVIVEDSKVCATIAETAIGNSDLSILVEALKAAKLVDVLSDASLVATVFAPTNVAFEKVIKQFNTTAEALLADQFLASILLYHVVPEVVVFSKDLVDGASVTTLLGQDVTVDLTDGVVIKGFGSSANVVIPDVEACKAVVHVIDEVLLPNFEVIPESAIIGSGPAPEAESEATVTLTISN
eukprot:TRINITY_DN853_c0_g1_i1.p3 TRINITY_DN853_c0_g1~~TRINITY_DN853_c0_g1_i1.p3  ORF type:complete len:308 (-),score=64.37 TRINITY_DN853_c0_g1_i1:362-1285(-)